MSVLGSILSMMNSEIKRARQQNLTHKENKWLFGALSEYEKKIEMRGYFVFQSYLIKTKILLYGVFTRAKHTCKLVPTFLMGVLKNQNLIL